MGIDSRDYYRPSGGFSFFPPVLKKIIILNVIVFFIQILSQQVIIGYNGMQVTLGFMLEKYFALNPLGGIGKGGISIVFYPWQLITYQFMHDPNNIMHIILNMFILWMFGVEIEHMMGSRRFLIFYLLCGIGAGLAQIFLSAPDAPTIGASGAVYGVMVAFAMFFPNRYIFISFLLPVKAKYAIVFLILLEFFSRGDLSVVAHLAHIGGALTGFILVLINPKMHFHFSNTSSKKKMDLNLGNYSFRKASKSSNPGEVEDAEFYDINEKKNEELTVTQEEIDRILDKISQSGYQNLTDREKKILFEASRKK